MVMLKLYNIGTFNTKRYTIGKIKSEEIDWYLQEITKSYFERYLDDKFSQYAPYQKTYILNNIRKMLEEHTKFDDTKFVKRANLLIRDISGKPVGGLTLMDNSDARCKITVAYWVVESEQRKGIATEVLRGLVQRLKKHRCFNYVDLECKVQSTNEISIKVIEKSGFKKAGTYAGRYVTNYVYRVDNEQYN